MGGCKLHTHTHVRAQSGACMRNEREHSTIHQHALAASMWLHAFLAYLDERDSYTPALLARSFGQNRLFFTRFLQFLHDE